MAIPGPTWAATPTGEPSSRRLAALMRNDDARSGGDTVISGVKLQAPCTSMIHVLATDADREAFNTLPFWLRKMTS